MRKVAFFDFNINFGGAPKGSINLAANIKKSGWGVVIYDVYGKNSDYLSFVSCNNIDLRVLSPESKRTFLGGRNILSKILKGFRQLPDFVRIVSRLRTAVKEDGVSLLWVNNTKSLFFSSLAVVGLGVPRVLYHRGWARASEIGTFDKFIIKIGAKVLVAHSVATTRNLKSLFESKPVYYVPNSVHMINVKHENRTSCGGQGGVFEVILPAARPVYEKGHHTAIDALSILDGRGHKNIKLVFPGKVPVGARDSYLNELKESIRASSLEKRVDFVGWVDDLPSMVAHKNLTILPSHTEGFPRVVIESMLLGVPVIATPVGGIPEAIIDGDTGYIVNVNDAMHLADTIEKVMINPVESRAMALRAKEFARIKFSSEEQTNGVLHAFEEALNDR